MKYEIELLEDNTKNVNVFKGPVFIAYYRHSYPEIIERSTGNDWVEGYDDLIGVYESKEEAEGAVNEDSLGIEPIRTKKGEQHGRKKI